MKKTYQAPDIVVVETDGMTLLAATVTGNIDNIGVGDISISDEMQFGSSRPPQSARGPLGGGYDIWDDEE